MQAWRRRGGPGLFGVLGVPLLMGTDLPALQDDSSSSGVAVLDRALAEALWPGENPLGRMLTDRGREYEVVGVTADFFDDRLRLDGVPHLFVASSSLSSFLVRTHGSPERVLAGLLDTVREVEPGMRVDGFTYHARRQLLSRSEAAHARFALMVVLATIVTCTFVLYAALNEVVHRRRTSAAVQLALGARPRQALRFLATGLARAAIVGGSTGLLLGLGAARLVAAVVPRVGPFELSGVVVCLASIFLSVGVAMIGPLRLVARADLATLLREGA